jgi:hypothetical protein
MQWYGVVLEPGGNLADTRSICVVEVFLRAEELYCFSPAADHCIKMAGLQTFANPKMGGHRTQHQNPAAFP